MTLDRAALRQRHVIFEDDDLLTDTVTKLCRACREVGPCPVIQLLDALEAAEQQVRQLRLTYRPAYRDIVPLAQVKAEAERDALKAKLAQVESEHSVLGSALNQYGSHFRVCLGEGRCRCGLNVAITAPNYKDMLEETEAKLAASEARAKELAEALDEVLIALDNVLPSLVGHKELILNKHPAPCRNNDFCVVRDAERRLERGQAVLEKTDPAQEAT